MFRAKVSARLAFGLALLLYASLPTAGTYTLATVSVSTTVSAKCKVVVVPAVDFGAYDPIGTEKTTNRDVTNLQITISCVGGSAPKIAIDYGLNATASPRKLKNTSSTDTLNYDLYKPDSSNACFSGGTPAVWGNSGTDVFTPPSNPTNTASQNYRICARLFAGQDPSVGTYNDTVNAIVNF